MAARRIKEIEVKVGGQILPEPHRLVVELDALGREVIGANDGGIAPGIATANVALLDDRHIGNAMVTRQVIGTGQAMTTCADDDHVIAGL